MESKPDVKGAGWYSQARRGNLAQRQPRTVEQIDQILRDNIDSDAQLLWEAVQKDLPSSRQRAEWYETPHEALGNQTPAEVIAAEGRYRRVLLALRPELINADCKM